MTVMKSEHVLPSKSPAVYACRKVWGACAVGCEDDMSRGLSAAASRGQRPLCGSRSRATRAVVHYLRLAGNSCRLRSVGGERMI